MNHDDQPAVKVDRPPIPSSAASAQNGLSPRAPEPQTILELPDRDFHLDPAGDAIAARQPDALADRSASLADVCAEQTAFSLTVDAMGVAPEPTLANLAEVKQMLPAKPAARANVEPLLSDAQLRECTDRELVDIMREGSPLLARRAYDVLYRQYQNPLISQARALRNARKGINEGAEDLAQEFWRKFWQRIRAPETEKPFYLEESFKGYAYTSIENHLNSIEGKTRVPNPSARTELPTGREGEPINETRAPGKKPPTAKVVLESINMLCEVGIEPTGQTNSEELLHQKKVEIYRELCRQVSPAARELIDKFRSGKPRSWDQITKRRQPITHPPGMRPSKEMCRRYPQLLAVWCIPRDGYKHDLFVLRRILKLDVGEIAMQFRITRDEVSTLTHQALEPFYQVLAYLWRFWYGWSDEVISRELSEAGCQEMTPARVNYYVKHGLKKLERAGGLDA